MTKIKMNLSKNEDGIFCVQFTSSDNSENREFKTPVIQMTKYQEYFESFERALIERNEFFEKYLKDQREINSK